MVWGCEMRLGRGIPRAKVGKWWDIVRFLNWNFSSSKISKSSVKTCRKKWKKEKLMKWKPGNIVLRFLLSFPLGSSIIRIQLGTVFRKCKFLLHSSVSGWKWESRVKEKVDEVVFVRLNQPFNLAALDFSWR